ncbi:MAG: DUF3043 domain-containing protein [Marmoricola sp.]
MFRRTTTPEKSPQKGTASSAADQPTQDTTSHGGKGRPTPSRKEAQAAARERAKAGKDTSRKATRERRTAQNRKVREGMRAGDQRYLPARDRGPVKRAVRDFVDSRLCFAEFLLPLLIIIMVLSQSHAPQIMQIANGLWTATFVLTLVDTGWMIFRLRKSLHQKFSPDQLKGTTFYAILRVLQMRFMRVPKATVGIGGKPKRSRK